jgi:dipeptidyl aminopeptidase/acylaminoacyl peptidase
MSPKEGAGNIREQVKAQVSEIKKLNFIDTNKMAFFGHSCGGYVASLFMAHEPNF